MATNAVIRSAVYDALVDVPGVNLYRFPPDSLSLPAAVVAGISVDPNTLTGGRETRVSVLVLVSHSHVSQLELLDELLDAEGSHSIAATIEARPDANGVSVQLDSIGSYGEMDWGGVSCYGAVITLLVFS